MNYQENFPYAVPRKEQRAAIEFARGLLLSKQEQE